MQLNDLLMSVEKPGRYIGGEWNSVTKKWAAEKVKVLLAFPDVYEIGMSYLGMKILYGILNERGDCLCERVFSPWPDFEGVLRKNELSIFSLESRKPIKEFDIIGFSLAYELTYTNVLNLLDLGKIPLKSSERSSNDPLIIAGGPSCYNPEPMAEFIDAFVIGDGEEAILEIVDMYKGFQVSSENGERKELLERLAKVRGIYVPSLYRVEYSEDGTIREFLPQEGISHKVEKRVVKDLDSAYYPTKQIVPNIGIVHDRISLEIMRGCKYACRFCQARSAYGPWRERSKEQILKLAKESYAATGYDEISLLSLSSSSHLRIRELIEELDMEFGSKAVSISVPSLRIEDILKELPRLLSKVKKAGLTFAPEAGSAELRKKINKNINIDRLFEVALESYKRGWRRLKLYFMLGLSEEEEKDIIDISELTQAISNLKRKVDGYPAKVTASINAFVPKPHTPFERYAMETIEVLERKKGLLKSSVRSRMVELDFHSFQMSFVEAVLSRGDRRVAKPIYESWKSGARFDGWQDLFNFDIWCESFKRTAVEPAYYISRDMGLDEILPWSFIDLGRW